MLSLGGAVTHPYTRRHASVFVNLMIANVARVTRHVFSEVMMQFVAELKWPAVVGAKGLSWLWKRSRGVAVTAVVVVAVVKVRAYIQKQQRRYVCMWRIHSPGCI